jgi:hypothetical protein
MQQKNQLRFAQRLDASTHAHTASLAHCDQTRHRSIASHTTRNATGATPERQASMHILIAAARIGMMLTNSHERGTQTDDAINRPSNNTRANCASCN